MKNIVFFSDLESVKEKTVCTSETFENRLPSDTRSHPERPESLIPPL